MLYKEGKKYLNKHLAFSPLQLITVGSYPFIFNLDFYVTVHKKASCPPFFFRVLPSISGITFINFIDPLLICFFIGMLSYALYNGREKRFFFFSTLFYSESEII